MFLTFHSNYNIILIYLYSRLIGLDFNFSLFLSAGICGFLPDLDNLKEFWGIIKKDKIVIYDHRNRITHKPLFWFIVILLLGLVNYSFQFLSWSLFGILPVSLFFHFIFDGLYDDEGVKWLWPFSQKSFPVLFKTKFAKWYDYFKRPGVLFFEFCGLFLALLILFKVLK